MTTSILVRLTTSLAAGALLMASGGSAAPLGTGFTYQGTLSSGGVPASGPFDFRFTLHDAVAGGSQVGPTVYAEDVGVSAGKVSVMVDFGAVFDGTALWMELGVRDGGSTGSYTVLTPRQPLSGSPYALHSLTAKDASYAASAGNAQSADVAASAGDAALLGGQSPSYYLAWGNLTGVPADLADGDDGLVYARTVVVGPVGTPTQNGAALLDALAAIPTPAAQADAWLLKVEPGLYDVGASSVTMKPWVDLEGSGETVTEITGTVCANLTGVVVTAADSELRMLSVRNTCTSGTWAAAVYGNAPNIHVRRLEVEAATSTQYGYGLWLDNGATGAVVEGVRASASALDYAYGAQIEGSNSTLDGLVATGSGASASNRGLYLAFALDVVVRDLTVTGSGPSSSGLYVYQSSGRFFDARAVGDTNGAYVTTPVTVVLTLEGLSAEGGVYGLYAIGSTLTVLADHCSFTGATSSVYRSNATVRVGASRLGGGPVFGTVTCAGVYDESFTFFASTCP